MACVCETYIPLCVDVNPCNIATYIGITPTEGDSGNWLSELWFNGVKTSFGTAVILGEEISILTALLNENYVHEYRLYNNENELYGCYKIHTTLSKNVAGAPVPPAVAGSWDWQSVAAAGNTVTSAYFTGELSPIIWLDSNPIEWAAAGITQDAETGTLNLVSIGGYTGTISFQYRNLA